MPDGSRAYLPGPEDQTFVSAPFAPNEAARSRLLFELGALDTIRHTAFDRLVYTAAQMVRTPIALLTLVEGDRQWFKAKVGLSVPETPRSMALCAHAILSDDMLVVQDARVDPRFAGNPLVTGAPHIRFYAGAPLIASDGIRLGTLCVIDTHARHSPPRSLQYLPALAAAATELILGRLAANEALGHTTDQWCNARRRLTA